MSLALCTMFLKLHIPLLFQRFSQQHSIRRLSNEVPIFLRSINISDIIDLRRLNFLKGLKSANNSSINLLHYSQAKKELESLLLKHELSFNESSEWKGNMLNNFVSSLNSDTKVNF